MIATSRERHLAGELEAHHDHPRDPEVEDLARRDERVGRVEGLERRGLLGPAERRERPQRAREPGVEDVLVLAQRAVAGAAALGRAGRDVGLLAGVAVVDRQAVAPPQLARDAPGADVLHPVEVDLRLALGVEADLAALDDLDRRLRELVHAHEPLQRDQRLDALARALGERHVVGHGSLCAQQAFGLERVDDRRLGLGDRQPRERAPASAFIRPSSPITEITASSWRRPISKSFGSCPGVIFSAPVPNSGLT